MSAGGDAMPTFTYTARDEQGLVQTGHLDAASEDEVVTVLQHRGLLVTRVALQDLKASAARPSSSRRYRVRMHGRVTTDDQVLLCQQLSTLVEAGVPLLKSLEVVCQQIESVPLLMALGEVRDDVAAGRTFSPWSCRP